MFVSFYDLLEKYIIMRNSLNIFNEFDLTVHLQIIINFNNFKLFETKKNYLISMYKIVFEKSMHLYFNFFPSLNVYII